MTDRELLELAAKAAGIDLKWDGDWPYRIKRTGNLKDWSPLTDDGDALRLAVKLQMSVSVFDDAIGIGAKKTWYNEYQINGDPYAATRRAIVRAAAEIGKGMP